VLGRARVLPVLRSDSAASARAQVDALVGAGLPAIELTRSTPGWAEALAGARVAHPQLCLGLGTVRDADDVRRAHDLEVDFLVTPWPAPAVRAAADELGVPLVEGGFTPGELAAAATHGPVKLFPAAPVGPGYLRALLPVLPGARVLPTGGIGLDAVTAWLDAGAHAVGVGSDLLRALVADPAGTAERLGALVGGAR